MARPVVIVGGGGCGREVLDVIDAMNASGESREVVGVLDDGEPDARLLSAYGTAHIGSVDALSGLSRHVDYVIGIGAPHVRHRIAAAAGGRGSPVLVHPTVAMGRKVHLQPGSVICAHSSLQNHIRIGRHVHINQNCTVGHDVQLGDATVVSPLVAISGNVTAGAGVFIGAGASVVPGVAIGEFATIGAGAAVIKDVGPGDTVVGVPAAVVASSREST